MATLYQPGRDLEREDIPCLNWLQATIRDNKLELHCMFRSNDLYGAWPSNMYLLTYLGLWLCEQFVDEEITFKGIHYHSSSFTGCEKCPTSFWRYDKWKTGWIWYTRMGRWSQI